MSEFSINNNDLLHISDEGLVQLYKTLVHDGRPGTMVPKDYVARSIAGYLILQELERRDQLSQVIDDETVDLSDIHISTVDVDSVIS